MLNYSSYVIIVTQLISGAKMEALKIVFYILQIPVGHEEHHVSLKLSALFVTGKVAGMLAL